MQQIEALITTADRCLSRTQPDSRSIFARLLDGLGVTYLNEPSRALPEWSREEVPNIVPPHLVYDIVNRLDVVGPAISVERVVSALAGTGGGFGFEKVVDVDTLIAALCFFAAGSWSMKLDIAFWAIDRSSRDFITGEDLLQFTIKPLLHICSAAAVLNGEPPPDPVEQEQCQRMLGLLVRNLLVQHRERHGTLVILREHLDEVLASAAPLLVTIITSGDPLAPRRTPTPSSLEPGGRSRDNLYFPEGPIISPRVPSWGPEGVPRRPESVRSSSAELRQESSLGIALGSEANRGEAGVGGVLEGPSLPNGAPGPHKEPTKLPSSRISQLLRRHIQRRTEDMVTIHPLVTPQETSTTGRRTKEKIIGGPPGLPGASAGPGVLSNVSATADAAAEPGDRISASLKSPFTSRGVHHDTPEGVSQQLARAVQARAAEEDRGGHRER